MYPQLVRADVVYSTIDPNATTYHFGSPLFISYPILQDPNSYQSYADQFSPSVTFTLSSISFGVRTIGSGFGDLNAIIYLNDPATNLPLTAAPLAISTAVAPPGGGDMAGQTVPLTAFDFSGLSISLLAGQKYWVALEPAGDGTDVDWGFTTNPLIARGPVAENFNNSGYHPFTSGSDDPDQAFGAFQIRSVPEPSVSFFLGYGGIGICSLWLKRRLRSKNITTPERFEESA
jgi:hypothetical protein